MTYEEATSHIKPMYEASRAVSGIGLFEQRPITAALEIAIEALEKQIPKKVVREAGKILYSCPNNRLHQMTVDKKGEFRYCSICGQALDWSDVK